MAAEARGSARSPKRRRLNESLNAERPLRGLHLVSVLSKNPRNKTISLHCRLPSQQEGEEASSPLARVMEEDGVETSKEGSGEGGKPMDNAVLILEKTSFDNSDLDTVLGDATTFRLQLKNDIYHSYLTRPPPDVNEVKATLVCPATAKHLEKYTQQEMFLVTETEQDYRDITLPFLLKSQFSLQWVYNILEGRAEQNRVVFDDPDPENGFVLLPDLKWDQKEATQLYLVAICRRRNIKSLRDLTGNHLPLLENVFFQTQAEVLSHFGVPASQLRCYLHYQPSYYHLHVHITHLAADVPGSGVERAHLLTDIIHDLRRDGDVCRTRPLSFPLRSNDELLARFRDAGRL